MVSFFYLVMRVVKMKIRLKNVVLYVFFLLL